GCPVKKVTKTGAGASLLEDPDQAARIVAAVAEATTLPVTAKMRRGAHDGSRDFLTVGPRLVAAVDVPVIASGDITSRARAQAVLATTGAAAVMVGRAAQGNPWALAEIM